MTIEVKILADSVHMAEGGRSSRLTTMQLKFPRFIHAEFMSHRVLSRNASSSRAIPVQRLIEDVERDPAMPMYWGRNEPGMQASTELSEDEKRRAIAIWNDVRRDSIQYARFLAFSCNAHKQIVNRLLEPFSHISVVVSSTKWQNFFALRCHPAAQPEMRLLAEAMREARRASTPRVLAPGEWHLPYITDDMRGRDSLELCKISAARCARVSYLRHDGTPAPVEEDLTLFERLAHAKPPHASPLEHQARATSHYRLDEVRKSNFHGDWRQFRHDYLARLR